MRFSFTGNRSFWSKKKTNQSKSLSSPQWSRVGFYLFFLMIAFGTAATITSADDLDVTLPDTATEGDGLLNNAGTVSVQNPPATDLVVHLTSDDDSEVTVPATVVIPAGHSSVTFDLTIIDDRDIDPIQITSITASTAGGNSGTGFLAIFDNEKTNRFKSIAAGRSHRVALKDDGTILAWGQNDRGQLGTGTTEDQPTPAPVLAMADVVAVSANEISSYALDASGLVWAWGRYSSQASNVPIQINDLSNVVAIATNQDGMLALKADGTVWQNGPPYVRVPAWH
jgi:hypothetical protein